MPILMLKAGVLSQTVSERIVTKVDDKFATVKGGRDRLHCGYTRYFPHDAMEEAKEWIINQSSRFERHNKITKESIDVYKSKDVQNKERETGKLQGTKKRRVR